MPQGKTIVRVATAPHRPIKPRPQLMLAYSGPILEIDTVDARISTLEAEIAAKKAFLRKLRASRSPHKVRQK